MQIRSLVSSFAVLAAACAGATPSDASKESDLTASPMFDSEDVLRFEIRAPLAAINGAQADRNADEPTNDGEIVVGDKHIPIKIGPRGRTSFDECRFRKLDVAIPDEVSAAGTVFAGLGGIKIGTHCDIEGESAFGRLGNEDAVYRERLAYRWYQEMSPTSLRSRPAVITYVWTDAPGHPPITKQAHVLEGFKPLRKRLGAKKVEPADVRPEKLDMPTLGTSYLFQLLIGNNDWIVGGFTNGHGPSASDVPGEVSTFNYKVIRTATTDLPLPYDFDIAEVVAGDRADNREFDPGYLSDRTELRGLVHDLVGFWKVFEDESHRRAVVDSVRSVRGKLEALTNSATIDEPGRTIAKKRLARFFTALDIASSFPVLARGPVTLFETATATQPFCTKVKGAFPIVLVEETPVRVGFRVAHTPIDYTECEGLPEFGWLESGTTLWADRARMTKTGL